MTSLHSLKKKKKNINTQLKFFYKKKFDISKNIFDLENAKIRVNRLIDIKRNKKNDK